MENLSLTELIKLAQGERTQNQYAMHCGISSATITSIKNGRFIPTADILKKLASKAYNSVTYEDFVAATQDTFYLKKSEKYFKTEKYFDNANEFNNSNEVFNSDIKNPFSQRLHELRKQKGITQYKLAIDLNLSQQVLSRYERGDCEANYKLLKKIAQYFDVSIDYLLGVSEYYYPDAVRSYATPTAPALTDKEEELLETFRRMPEGSQAIALDTMHSLAGDNAHVQSVKISHKRA